MENLVVCLEASNGASGRDVLYDEVRLRPKGAQMTSAAYNSQGQITSLADVNETTTHFEYDALGNLMGIKNDDGVVISEQGKKYGIR
jgi:YD repeat-containing protein